MAAGDILVGRKRGDAVCPCQNDWRTGEYHNSKCPEAIKLRDSWCTPADVAKLLPMVDLDPATNSRSRIKARRHIVWSNDYHSVLLGEPDRKQGDERWQFGNGLAMPWNGSVFLNGPYSDMLPWCQKANEEWGAGRLTAAIFLVKLDPTTRWWRELVQNRKEQRTQVWLPRKRLQHIPPPRVKASTNNFASAIIHWRRPMKNDFWDLPLAHIADLWT